MYSLSSFKRNCCKLFSAKINSLINSIELHKTVTKAKLNAKIDSIY